MEATSIYYSKSKLIMINLIGLGFIALGVVCLLVGFGVIEMDQNSGLFTISGIIITIVGILALFVAIKKLLLKTPAIILDQEGIHDFIARQPIVYRWSNVQSIEEMIIKGRRSKTKLIRINVKNIEDIVNQTSGKTKLITEVATESFPYGSMSSGMLKISHDDLLELLNRYHQHYGASNTGSTEAPVASTPTGPQAQI